MEIRKITCTEYCREFLLRKKEGKGKNEHFGGFLGWQYEENDGTPWYPYFRYTSPEPGEYYEERYDLSDY